MTASSSPMTAARIVSMSASGRLIEASYAGSAGAQPVERPLVVAEDRDVARVRDGHVDARREDPVGLEQEIGVGLRGEQRGERFDVEQAPADRMDAVLGIGADVGLAD